MGRTYAHIFRYVSCGIGHNKTNRRTIQIADGQLDAINPPIIFPTPASAPSAPREMVSFPALFRVPLLRFGRLSSARSYACFFREGTNRRPPRRLIQPLGMEGNAMVTFNVYVYIEPMSKIQNMLLVSPALRGKSSRRSR